ncbi:MAG: hypothetical protein D6743_09420 [Calditrichaeota bacterium]|nr:MAG: hypothetical protein D6743_09420 [Calditrichota bacterium]
MNGISLNGRINTNKKYYLLLIDIKKSTRMRASTRKKIFHKLKSKIEELNKTLSPKPLIELTINYGDEIAGLFETPSPFYHIISELREAIYPEAAFRFVAGYGRIGMPSTDLREVGGEVFKQANECMRRLKAQDNFCAWSLKDKEENLILNSLVEMSNTLLQRMTAYQHQVYLLLKAGMSQKKISEELSKYPQSVSNAIKRGASDQVIRAERVIHRMLEKY